MFSTGFFSRKIDGTKKNMKDILYLFYNIFLFLFLKAIFYNYYIYYLIN